MQVRNKTDMDMDSTSTTKDNSSTLNSRLEDQELDLTVKGEGLSTSPPQSKLETTTVRLPKICLFGASSNKVEQGGERLENNPGDCHIVEPELQLPPQPQVAKISGKDALLSKSPPKICGPPPLPLKPTEDQMTEITNDFFQAVKTLELGELLHDPSFGLFEAMSAIEMMDPKMDAGMICNKGNRVILNFDQALKEGVLKLENLSYEELIGIHDTTLSCLVTWLEGHSLAQTVFTNLYLHQPTSISDKYLKAISVATLKLVDVIEECISKAGVFEEEDFQPSVYGYNLATSFADTKVASMLRECEDELQKKLKNTMKSQSKGEANIETEKEIEQIHALLARLKFMRMFHSLVLHIWKRDNNMGDCPKLLLGCQEALQIMQKTSLIGLQRSNDESECFMVGFELLVNQRLLPPTFPRSTKIKSNEEAFCFIDGLLLRIKTVLKVTTIPNFHGIVDFFHLYSESRPCVLSRSFLQLLYGPMRFKKVGQDDLKDMMEAMKESVKNFIAPPVLTSKTLMQRKDVSECVDMFFERCAPVFANLLIACGHNRARQRDRLAHMMDDFANLQIETERIDSYINGLLENVQGIQQHGNCFGTWLLCHISKLMIRYILSGFELELYSVHEFAYVYWYLYEFLYAWLLSTYTRADAYIMEGETVNVEKLGKKSAKNRQKSNKAKSKAYTKELLMLQAEQNLAGGYFKAMMGLFNDRRVPFPHMEFDDESVRYRHRFAPFIPIQTPALVHYSQYKQLADMTYSQPAVNLYVASARSFHQAKQLLEAIPGSEKEVADLLKIAKRNFVVVKLLASGHTKESSSPPEFDFSAHMHFPVLTIK